MSNLRGYELLIIVLIVVLLFGAKRLPDAARSVGRSLRIFKAETKALTDAEPSQSEPRATDPNPAGTRGSDSRAVEASAHKPPGDQPHVTQQPEAQPPAQA